MLKKILIVFLAMLLVTPYSVAFVRASPGTNPPPNQMSILWETIGTIYTVDPAWCYDTASASLIFNVLEPLIFFEGERFDRFHGVLATEVYLGPPAPGSPIYTNHTYYFKIRENVPFHTQCKEYTWDQYYLTPYDVEYSFERWSIISPAGYAHWMLFEAVFGGYYDPDPSDPVTWGHYIDDAFESNSTHFWINIANEGFAPATEVPSFDPIPLLPLGPDAPGLAEAPINYPPGIFLQVIAQSWASILSHDWIVNWVNPNAAAQGFSPQEWDGNWGDYTTWVNYHEPETPVLDTLYAVSYTHLTLPTN